MKINAGTGLVDGVRFIKSPNFDQRPPDSLLNLIIIHAISLPPGHFGGPWIDDLFTNALDPQADPYFAEIYQLKVSAHALIRRDGEIIQYVPFQNRAWHAGISTYQGRDRCNDFSIGIELEGCDEQDFDEIQYTQLANLITSLLHTYPELSAEHIVGHCDVAPGRKTDPGPCFDWQKLNSLLSLKQSQKY